MRHRIFLWGALLLLLLPRTLIASIVIDGPMTYEKVTGSGSHYSGEIPVRNAGLEPVDVRIYQTDYHFSANGSNEYGPPGKRPRSNANWISLAQEQVTIAPGQTIHISYLVEVANDARLSGTYWSMLMVEQVQRADSKPAPEQPGAQLSVALRYGIQVLTHIGDGGRLELSFVNPQLVEAEGRYRFSIDLENPGERWIRPKMSLQLLQVTDGKLVGTFRGDPQRLYPGTSARASIPLDDVPAGQYRGLLIADGGEEELFGSQIMLTIP